MRNCRARKEWISHSARKGCGVAHVLLVLPMLPRHSPRSLPFTQMGYAWSSQVDLVFTRIDRSSSVANANFSKLHRSNRPSISARVEGFV